MSAFDNPTLLLELGPRVVVALDNESFQTIRIRCFATILPDLFRRVP